MDNRRFDGFVRELSTGSDRRRVLKTLAGASAGSLALVGLLRAEPVLGEAGKNGLDCRRRCLRRCRRQNDGGCRDRCCKKKND